MAEKKKADKKGVYYVLIMLLVCLIITALILYTYQEKNRELQTHKDVLIERLAETIKEYKNLKTDNDSLQNIIDQEEGRLVGMHDSLASRVSNSYEKLLMYERRFFAMRDELNQLRREADSLRLANDSLSRENTELTNEAIALKEVKQELEEKIEANTGLRISAFTVEPINKRSLSGKEEVSTENFWLDYLRLCYNVEKNEFTSEGEKTVYIRIVTPENTIMKSEDPEPFIPGSNGEDQLLYTQKHIINYQGDPINKCVQINRLEFAEGQYQVELFVDSLKTATTNFTLD